VRVDRGDAGAPGPLPADGPDALADADAVLVADYGRGVAASVDVRAALGAVAARTPIVWDPHPRGPRPVPATRLATPNQAEAAQLVPGVPGDGIGAVARRADVLGARWRTAAVTVTLGARGALLAGHGGLPLLVPAPAVSGGDACGAGDCFAGAAALALARGAVLSEAVESAVARAAAFVAAGGAGGAGGRGRGPQGPSAAAAAGGPWADPFATAAAVRAAGSTVVATGGCFDLLHAGHVAMLQAARRLGDCLVVLLNADASVRRLKGPDRPLQRQEDRVAVLAALDCVDAVVTFDEDTPAAVLDRLRPELFVKGGDYAAADLPEAAALARWGGQAVVVPYLEGRSTTRLIEEASRGVIT